MFRELLRIPGLDIPIYSFGLMLVIGCWLAISLAKFLAKRCGLNPEHFVNIGIIALVAGVVGARLSHVLENFNQYFGPQGEGLLSAINIRSGGLTYYGGVLLATPICIWYARRHRILILRGMDIIAPCLMIGLGLGRVGCFLNGCCFGAACDLPIAVTFPYNSPAYEEHLKEHLIAEPPAVLNIRNPLNPLEGHWATDAEVKADPQRAEAAKALRSAPVHASQLYSTLAAGLVCLTLVLYFTLNPSPGKVFALMMVMEGFARFTLETLRVEPAVTHVFGFAWSLSMVLGAVLFIGGLVFWLVLSMTSSRSMPSLQPCAERPI
jgi:phosphatidylglycerol:prolipoprotein diacylglycerol transferase